MAPLHWSVDTNDWRLPGADAIAGTLRTAGPGSVILLHDAGGDRSQTIAALTAVLPDMKGEGVQFVTP
jgi:peptidoglycan-N-acetylglucosamine deacetylase